MKYFQLAIALALGAPLMAQPYISSPKGLMTTEGNNNSNMFGAWANGRYQHANADLEGRASRVAEVAYRVDYRDYGSEGGGRKWKNVTLHVSECAVDSANVVLTPEYSTNSVTKPTKVFDNAVKWADLRGFPSTEPAAWSIKFPFSAPWTYSGKGGMLFDYQFDGGALANSGTWVGNMYKPYVLDGVTTPTYYNASGAKYLGDLRKCKIGSNTYAARNYTSSRTFAGNYSNSAAAGKYGYSVNTYYCNAGFNILMVGIKGDETGTDVGMCNNLYVDVATAAVIPQTSTGTHIFGSFWYLPWDPAYVGLDIYAQTAIPLGPGKTNLSVCHKNGVPLGIPPTVKRASVYGYDKNLARGLGVDIGPNSMPVGRIWFK